MKKIYVLITSVMLLVGINNFTVNAQNNYIEINCVEYLSDGSIGVNAYISAPADNQKVTIMVTEYDASNNSYALNDVVYVNELNANIDSQNKFGLNFKPAKWFGEKNRIYVVMLGGTNIDKAEYILLYLDKNQDIDSVYFGDVNADGVIDYNDVNIIMSYVLNKDNNDFDFEKIKRSDVTADGDVNATDVAAVVEKINNIDYIFRSEK